MADSSEAAPERPGKGAAAFRTIGEVANDLDLPAHVLRFWETKFPQLKPLKRGGGRRYYRPEDILLLRRIRQCLYEDGYTIRGVQQLLGSPRADTGAGSEPDTTTLFPAEPVGGRHAPPRPPNGTQPLPPSRIRGRPGKPNPRDPDTRSELEEIRRELREARALLDRLRKPGTP